MVPKKENLRIFVETIIQNRANFFKSKNLKDTIFLNDAISDLLKSNGTKESPDTKSFQAGIYTEATSSYQKLMRQSKPLTNKIADSHRFAKHRIETIEKFQYILDNGIVNKNISNKIKEKFNIKKRTVVLLCKSSPTPTLTTLPDDYIHYCEPRILTVREYARIQSFPDSYEFKVGYTTGGERRKIDVPRYTKIGNAIPPLFAEQVGNCFKGDDLMKTSDCEGVYFLSHVNIKNIIGKELINDDNVAVMELVKNSYDAGAKKVTVEFKNLKSKDKKDHQIIIADDGMGMSKEDILHKWLNLAYSIKRVQNAQNNRLQASNKGIGRFSCDRLGKQLDIYTKQNSKAYHLKINWEDFENIEDYSVQINEIPMQLREVFDREIKKDTSYKINKNGTIVKISYLRTKWIKLNEDNLFNDVLNFQKIVSLKSTLEKLINKSQVESDNFKIFLKADDIDDKTEESYNRLLSKVT